MRLALKERKKERKHAREILSSFIKGLKTYGENYKQSHVQFISHNLTQVQTNYSDRFLKKTMRRLKVIKA